MKTTKAVLHWFETAGRELKVTEIEEVVEYAKKLSADSKSTHLDLCHLETAIKELGMKDLITGDGERHQSYLQRTALRNLGVYLS